MKYFSLSKDGGIATVTLSRDKVNALNEPFVEQISGCFKELEQDIGVKSIILSGEGKFFSFGFDIPEFLHYSGAMYSAEEAYNLGLIDRVTTGEDLKIEAVQKSSELGEKPSPAFASMKSLLRKPIVEEMKQREKESIREFVDIWYSDLTWKNLKNTKIY